jgi:hypothetical protein
MKQGMRMKKSAPKEDNCAEEMAFDVTEEEFRKIFDNFLGKTDVVMTPQFHRSTSIAGAVSTVPFSV